MIISRELGATTSETLQFGRKVKVIRLALASATTNVYTIDFDSSSPYPFGTAWIQNRIAGRMAANTTLWFMDFETVECHSLTVNMSSANAIVTVEFEYVE